MNSRTGDDDPEAVKQVVAPHDGCAISLVDFSISLTRPSTAEKERVIIHPLSTSISTGALFAILGGSGSGKTTLLNVLASRYDNRHFIVHGQVHFSSGGHVGYVTQNDFLLPFLTVHETLLFTAKLKLAGDASTTALVALVDQVVLDLGLRECAQTRIGDDANAAGLRGISGGEKRRVSVGVQILTNPQVLCADEPTSGLDSFTAVTVVECLRRLSEQRGMTVVCSIHQPRADIFFLFDDVLLLTKGGHAIYCGPTKALVGYFDRLGYACPASANPADFFVDLSSVDIYADGREQRLQCMRRLRHLVSAFQANQTKASSVATKDHPMQLPPTTGPSRAPWALQVWVLLQRFTLNTLRDRSSLLGGVVQATVLGLVLMGIFFALDESYAAVRSRTGLLYISVSLESYIMMIILVHKYCSEVKVLDRELQDELYHPTAYFIAHFLSSAPPLLILPMTIFSLPAYFGTRLRLAADDAVAAGDDHETGRYFGTFLAVMLTLVLCINGMSWTSVSLSRQFSIASLISNMSFTFLSLSCGFLVNLDEMPVYTRWLKHVTFLSYGYRILMQNEFQGRVFHDCDDGGACVTFAGDDVLPSYGVERNNYRSSWPVLLGIALLYHVLPMIFLSWLRFPPIAAATEQPAKSAADGGDDDDDEEDELALLARWEHDAANASPTTDLPAICDIDDPATDPATTVPAPSTDAAPATRDVAGDGSSTPHPALWNIDVQDVDLFATLPRGPRKQLLYDVNVRITAGRLVALLGGSGSGKSTLLNLVANRIPHAALRASDAAVDAAVDAADVAPTGAPPAGLARGLSRSYSALATAAQTPRASRGVGGKYSGTGRVFFSGRVAPPALVRSLVGYVQQHDFHLPSLTVAETLLFHAQLRLDAHRAAVASAQVYAARVQSALQLMGLTRCRHVRVGDAEAKGISGGEKRRLSVAVQLLSDPSVCLLDEPTTGLDAFTARHVVWTLKRLATGAGAVDGTVDAAMQRPRTVALSIHQPRYDVFALFDDVILLSRGHVLWSGGAAELLRHLSRLGMPCPPLTNPADFALDVSSIDTRTVDAESTSRARWTLLVAAFANRSTAAASDDAVVAVENVDVDAATAAAAAAVESDAAQIAAVDSSSENGATVLSNEKPFIVAYPLVLGRAWRNLRRQPELLTVRLSQTLFFALILCAFYAPTQNSQRSIQNRVGNLYEFTALTFVGMLNCIAIFPAERDVFYREYFDGCYSAWTFAAAYLSLAAPLSAVAAIAFAVLMACAVGLQPTALAVAQFSYIAWTFLVTGEALGVLFCTLFDEIGFSVNVVSVVISFFGVMAGFISPTMPRGLVMLSYASPMRWGAYLLMHIAFEGEQFDCDGTAVQCLTTGEEVLELYNFGSRDNYEHGRFGGRFFYGMTAVVTAAFVLVAVASLRLRALRLSH